MSIPTLSGNFSTSGSANLKSIFYKEGERLLGATKKVEELWYEMREADFRREGILNEKNIQIVHEKKKQIIKELLNISTAQDFLDVFDDDQVYNFNLSIY